MNYTIALLVFLSETKTRKCSSGDILHRGLCQLPCIRRRDEESCSGRPTLFQAFSRGSPTHPNPPAAADAAPQPNRVRSREGGKKLSRAPCASRIPPEVGVGPHSPQPFSRVELEFAPAPPPTRSELDSRRRKLYIRPPAAAAAAPNPTNRRVLHLHPLPHALAASAAIDRWRRRTRRWPASSARWG